jgi:hypothetical protein
MTKKLPKHIKTWIKALRSGEYKQCQGTLKGELVDGSTGFCCLGVYNEVVLKLPLFTQPLLKNAYGVSVSSAQPCADGPGLVYSKIRKRVNEAVVDEGIKMNDNGEPFKEIADMIEKHYA